MYNEAFMQHVIGLSRRALDTPGTEPFGAVVVRNGEIVGEGLNHAWAKLDPTAHGEVEAIRDACRKLHCISLEGCEVYTSCEPCPVCVATMGSVGITKLYYAASLVQSRAATAAMPESKRRRVDVQALRREVALPVEQRQMPSEQHLAETAVDVIAAWAARQKG